MKQFKYVKGLVITLVSFALIAVLALALLGYTRRRVTSEQAELLRASLYKAAVNGYAVTGRYPSLEEIEEDYGVVIDRDHFNVYYDSFASNVLPSISVTVRGEN